MANEIKTSGSLTLAKGNAKATLSGNGTFDMLGEHYIQRVDTIDASEEAVSKGDIANLGFCAFRNGGTSGTISIGGVTGAYLIDLGPGEFAGPLRWSTNAVFAKGDIAGCLLEMILIEK